MELLRYLVFTDWRDMLITKVKINSLAPYSQIEISGLREFNIFIGANNSGKSKILRAIALVRNIGGRDNISPPPTYFDYASYSITWTFNAKLGEIFPNVDDFQKLANPLKSHIRKHLAEHGIDFEINLDHRNKFTDPKRPLVGSNDLYATDSYTTSMPPTDFVSKIATFRSNYFKGLASVFKPINQGIISVIGDSMSNFHHTKIFDLSQSNYRKLYPEFIDKFKNFSNAFPEIQFSQKELISVLSEKSDESIITSSFMNEGLGCQRALQILWEIFILRKIKKTDQASSGLVPILFIDEPELSMHAGLQRKIMGFLSKLADEMQIFVATHSPIFARPTQGSTVVLFPLARSKEQPIIIADPSELIEVGNVLGIRNEDYFGYSRMLILEGDTEEAFVTKLLEKRRIDPYISGLKIVNMGGVSRFKNYKKNYVHQFFKTLFDFSIKVRVLTDNEEPAPTTKDNLDRDFKNVGGSLYRRQLWPTNFEASFPIEYLHQALIECAKMNSVDLNLLLDEFSKRMEENGECKFPKAIERIYEEQTQGEFSKGLFGICLAEHVFSKKESKGVLAVEQINELLKELDLDIHLSAKEQEQV